ncbi:hypothetical protein ACHQM5_026628 [Ranunculus cassubicifolius]
MKTLSIPDDESDTIPASTRCLLKSFTKKNVALGNIRTDETPIEGLYQIRMDDIFDPNAELYGGGGTFQDLRFGSTIKWPKIFVEMI